MQVPRRRGGTARVPGRRKRWSREKGSLGFWVPGLEVMGSRVPSKVLSDITLVLWVQAAGFGNRQGLDLTIFLIWVSNIFTVEFELPYANKSRIFFSFKIS